MSPYRTPLTMLELRPEDVDVFCPPRVDMAQVVRAYLMVAKSTHYEPDPLTMVPVKVIRP